MTQELEHKIVEHIMMTRTLMQETIEDYDHEPSIVSREISHLWRCDELLKQLSKPVETTHETRTVQQPCSKTPAGGDGK